MNRTPEQIAKVQAMLDLVDSRVYPGLERVPGNQNWVDAVHGLPDYIERIAKHLHYEKGMSISRAIAVAVNTVKRWAAGGTVTEHGTTKRVSAATIALASKALAEWEAKKAAAHSLSDADVEPIDLAAGTPPKCAYCSAPATKKILHSEGMAFIPVCDAHLARGKSDAADSTPDGTHDPSNINSVTDLADANISPTDTMVCVLIPKDVAGKLAVPGGTKPEDMHVTLTFHGDTTDQQFDAIAESVKKVAASATPLKGKIAGAGMFPPEDGKDLGVHYAPVDVPGLSKLREAIHSETQNTGAPPFDDHGFTPHATRTFAKAAPEPVKGEGVAFSHVSVVRGGKQRKHFKLGSGEEVDLSESEPLRTPENIAKVEAMIDLALTKDGRKSFKHQGKWRHGFIPVDTAAKTSKAKGSPIAMKRMNRLYGSQAAPVKRGPTQLKGASRPKAKPKPIRVRSSGTSIHETAADVGKLHRVAFKHASQTQRTKLKGKRQGITKRSNLPWSKIPESQKTIRDGHRYVLAQYGGETQLVEWTGPTPSVGQTALKNRRLFGTISAATLEAMTTAELRALIKNKSQKKEVKKAAYKVLTRKAAEARKHA